MKTKLTHFAIILCICSLLVGCFAKKAARSKASTSMKTLSESKFSIAYPAEWSLTQAGEMGTTFILKSPSDGIIDLFRENINLIIQDVTHHSLDLDEYTEISLSQLKKHIKNSNIETSERITAANHECQKLIFTGTAHNYDLRFIQYLWIHEEESYVLTFTGEIDKYEQYKDLAFLILDSFKFE